MRIKIVMLMIVCLLLSGCQAGKKSDGKTTSLSFFEAIHVSEEALTDIQVEYKGQTISFNEEEKNRFVDEESASISAKHVRNNICL